jgi:hypothetical protein
MDKEPAGIADAFLAQTTFPSAGTFIKALQRKQASTTLTGCAHKLLETASFQTLPKLAQAYWLKLALACTKPLPSKGFSRSFSIFHFLYDASVDKDPVSTLLGGVKGGRHIEFNADNWDSEEYTSMLEKNVDAVRAKWRSLSLTATAVDHAGRVMLAVQCCKRLCEELGLNPGANAKASLLDASGVTNSVSLRCAAAKYQVQCLRPMLKALQRFQKGSTKSKALSPVLWEALEEFLAAALGTPLHSTLDLLPEGVRVEALGAPDVIIEQGVVGTAKMTHVQCFAGNIEVLVPYAQQTYRDAIAGASSRVQDIVIKALNASGSLVAREVLGPVSSVRPVAILATNAVAALMKHELQTLVLGSDLGGSACPIE